MGRREKRKGTGSVKMLEWTAVWTVSIILPQWPQDTATVQCVFCLEWSSVLRRISEKPDLSWEL